MSYQILLGRIETVQEYEAGLNFGQLELVEKKVPRVITWITLGDEDEEKKARDFIEEDESGNPWEIFTFGLEVKDAFEETKKILRERIENEE